MSDGRRSIGMLSAPIPPSPGTLNQRVTLVIKTWITNAMGESVQTSAPFVMIWCRIEPLGGREYWDAQAVRSEATHKIMAYFHSELKSENVIRDSSGVSYEIMSARDLGSEKRYVECIAKVVTQ